MRNIPPRLTTEQIFEYLRYNDAPDEYYRSIINTTVERLDWLQNIGSNNRNIVEKVLKLSGAMFTVQDHILKNHDTETTEETWNQIYNTTQKVVLLGSKTTEKNIDNILLLSGASIDYDGFDYSTINPKTRDILLDGLVGKSGDEINKFFDKIVPLFTKNQLFDAKNFATELERFGTAFSRNLIRSNTKPEQYHQAMSSMLDEFFKYHTKHKLSDLQNDEFSPLPNVNLKRVYEEFDDIPSKTVEHPTHDAKKIRSNSDKGKKISSLQH